MKTNIAVEIKNIGDVVGTLGWLLAQEIKIRIGKTTDGKIIGCWVFIGGEQEPVAFLNHSYCRYVGFCPSSGVNDVPLTRYQKQDYCRFSYAFEVNFTDAAWEKVEEIAEMARETFRAEMEKFEAQEAEMAEEVTFAIAPASPAGA